MASLAVENDSGSASSAAAQPMAPVVATEIKHAKVARRTWFMACPFV
jgi:hypothetical protein